MNAPHISVLLQDGIQAVKRGEREKARTLLTQVVEQDETNEQAWLWLSGAVDTDEERRVCLENVLALNPNNAAAQRGLARLGPAAAEPLADGEHVVPPTDGDYLVRREVAPVSLAAAILHPEQQVKEWRWRDPTLPIQPPNHDPLDQFSSLHQSSGTFGGTIG